MIVLVTGSEEMRRIDREAMDSFGIPGVVLMENAAIKLYQNIACEDASHKGVCILCGKGNNGGDGFAAARHLVSSGRRVVIYLAADEKELKGDALINYNIVKNMGLDIRFIKEDTDIDSFLDSLGQWGILVDGLLGTGVKGEVKGIYRKIIHEVNKLSPYVIAIDIPSGIDADTGRILGCAIRAKKTVTFALPKIGLLTYPGAEYAGQVVVEDITIPHKLLQKQNLRINLIEEQEIAALLPQRRKDANKGTYGRALIVGGSRNMMGAPAMCTLSALRCGAGIVEVCVPESIQERVAPLVVEAIVKGLPEEDGKISAEAFDSIFESIKRASAFAIGPGLSTSQDLMKLMSLAIESASGLGTPGVIDADGLNLIAKKTGILENKKCSLILTPHPGEMARLTGRDVGDIQENRINCATEFAEKYGVVLVLKGANTVIASPDGRVFINSTGGPGMAKGGSGDILTGMIVSFLAQGMDPVDAARAGVYIHGLAGDKASEYFGEYSMKACDIIDFIPKGIMYAMNRITGE